MAAIRDYLSEGTRILWTAYKYRFFPKRYEGTAEDICQKIVKECWNGRYFQASSQNFPQFWTRDFGWCVQSLLKMGYEKEIHQTLRYAVNRFKSANKITTTISARGRPFDVFAPAVDSLPWLIHSMKIAKFPHHSFKSFLNRQIKHFFQEFIDDQTGLVRPNIAVSSMKDFSIRKSSCYDNCMIGLLAKDLENMKLDNPFRKYDYPAIIQQHFWNGNYFYDDLQQKPYVAGDANLFPFLFGLCKKEEMLTSAVRHIQEAGLDRPLPLRYTASREGVVFGWQERFFKDYESNCAWTHMGPLFIRVVGQINKKKSKEYQADYKTLIEKHQGFPEVLFPDGRLFRTMFYLGDRTMLWACNYLTL